MDKSSTQRLPAIDWMRGIVLVIMVTDHASAAFNANRLFTDTAMWYQAGQSLPVLEFANRWISHLCAPVFLFLAGTALFLSLSRKGNDGMKSGSIDADLLIRGALILAVDLTLISYFWFPVAIVLQVMYAIGLSMMAMTVLRRLTPGLNLILALILITLPEFFARTTMPVPDGVWPHLQAFLFSAGSMVFSLGDTNVQIVVGYPLSSWLGVMLLGWCFGYALKKTGGMSPGRLLIAGLVCLMMFVTIRGVNGFGNMLLPRDDGSLIQWLHVSKYPPSLSFLALELGLMLLMLAGLFHWQNRTEASRNNWLLLFGQTSLFFYVAHVVLLELGARALGVYQTSDLIASWWASLVTLALLVPLCFGFRRLKQRHPKSWLRFI